MSDMRARERKYKRFDVVISESHKSDVARDIKGRTFRFEKYFRNNSKVSLRQRETEKQRETRV